MLAPEQLPCWGQSSHFQGSASPAATPATGDWDPLQLKKDKVKHKVLVCSDCRDKDCSGIMPTSLSSLVSSSPFHLNPLRSSSLVPCLLSPTPCQPDCSLSHQTVCPGVLPPGYLSLQCWVLSYSWCLLVLQTPSVNPMGSFLLGPSLFLCLWQEAMGREELFKEGKVTGGAEKRLYQDTASMSSSWMKW